MTEAPSKYFNHPNALVALRVSFKNCILTESFLSWIWIVILYDIIARLREPSQASISASILFFRFFIHRTLSLYRTPGPGVPGNIFCLTLPAANWSIPKKICHTEKQLSVLVYQLY